MKDLLKSNCFDISETIIVVGTCVKNMQPIAFKKLEEISENIYEVCLEETHMNMVVTKIIGMLARGKIQNLIFATVDKSPHCIQIHYMRKELENMMDLKQISITNFVTVDNELIEIPLEVIGLSKNLKELKNEIL